MAQESLEELLAVDEAGWRQELAAIGSYLQELSPRLPEALAREQARIAAALARSTEPSQRSVVSA